MTILPIQAQTTKVSAGNGAWVDVSTITGDWTLKVQLSALTNTGTPTPQVRFQFTDSLASGTASLAGPSFSFLGTIGNTADIVKGLKKQDFPDLRLGTATADLRFDLTAINANSSVTYSAWVEY